VLSVGGIGITVVRGEPCGVTEVITRAVRGDTFAVARGTDIGVAVPATTAVGATDGSERVGDAEAWAEAKAGRRGDVVGLALAKGEVICPEAKVPWLAKLDPEPALDTGETAKGD